MTPAGPAPGSASDPATGPGCGASPGGGAARRRWSIAGDRYVATFGFSERAGPFAGALSCLSLTRDGVELLAPPGAPLVVPWMGRLSGWSFEVLGQRVDLAGDPRVTPDDRGRPLHGLAVDPAGWQVEVGEGSTPGGLPGVATLVVTADLAFGAAFPFDQRVRVVATVDAAGLEVRTTVEATGAHGVPVALGWHPYLRAPGTTSEQSGVEVLLPFEVACELEGLLPTGVQPTVVPGWVRDPVMDDHWRAAPGQCAVVRSGDLEVALTFGTGYGWAMTWVPAPGAGFVCIEPMAAPLDPFRPGAPTPGDRAGAPMARAGYRWVGEFRID